MLNFCVFTFILYAVGGSVKTILFGKHPFRRRDTSHNLSRQRAIN